MKRVVPRVSRQFPEEFYSDDRQQLSSQQQSAKQFSSDAKTTRGNAIQNSPSQNMSTFEDENLLQSTANFKVYSTGMRVSQSQDNLFKQTQYEKKKLMDFTFCLADNKKIPLRQTQKILPPLLQNQNKVFNSIDSHPLNAYQLDQYVKQHIKRVSPHQQGQSDINQNDSDSLTKMTNDQSQIQDSQVISKKEEDTSSEEKRQNNNKLRFQSYSVLSQDLRKKQRNIANLISNTAFQQLQQVNTLNKNSNQNNPNQSSLSSTSNLENIHPNICQASTLESNNNNEQNQTKLNINKARQYYASPASNSLSRNRDPSVFQQKISTIANPTRQSYQSLQKGELKINSNFINPSLSIQQNSNHKFNSSTIDIDDNNKRGKQIEYLPIRNTERSQNSSNAPKANLNNQQKLFNSGVQNRNIKQINQLNPNNNIESNNVLIKLSSNNSQITTLPVLNMVESYNQKISRDTSGIDISDNQNNKYSQFKNQNNHSQDNKVAINNSSKLNEALPNKQRINNLQNSLVTSPRFISISEKQKLYYSKSPSNQLTPLNQYNAPANSQKIPFNKSILSSPKTVPVKQLNQENLSQGQLDKLQNPEWFYNQLGRPNLFSYQEKRHRVIQHYQRNIHSQQSKEEGAIQMSNIFSQKKLDNKNPTVNNLNSYFAIDNGYIKCHDEEDFPTEQ